VLVAEQVSKRFSGVTALDGVDVEIAGGEIAGLVGPNGSGKSTLLGVLSGFVRPDGGRVKFDDTYVRRPRPWTLAAMGVRRTFQLPQEPRRMTVLETMLTGDDLTVGATIGGSLFRRRRVASEQRDAIAKARRLLEELTLSDLGDRAAGSLSGGQQKLLSLGVALMGEPRVLLLDEPAAGVNPNLRKTLVDRLRAAHASGTTLLVIEHDMGFVADLCERVYVLDRGRLVTCCAPGELASDPRVVEAYLGKKKERKGSVPGPMIAQPRKVAS
jgi:ABC-type branched-subunit amino acid transport system ATPase component